MNQSMQIGGKRRISGTVKISKKGRTMIDSQYKELKEQMCEICHKMWQLGWVAANDGNVSVKLEDGSSELMRMEMFWKDLMEAARLLR